MAARSVHNWLPMRSRPRLVGLVLLLWAALAARAPATEIHYLKDISFRVPFVTNPAQQRLIRQVVLYVSEDYGKTYKIYDQKPATETGFLFHAAHQGWYWFTVQAQYVDGRNVPADPNAVPPGLKICVDTNPPTVALKQIQPREGTLGVEWDIRDDNPDLLSIHLDYRPLGSQDWIPLSQVPPVLYSQFGWTPLTSATQYEVRLQVKDRANNQAEKTIRLTPGQARPQQPLDGGMGFTASSAGNKVTMLNSRNIKLNYDLFGEGKSGVKMIEVYVTQNTRDWKKAAEEPPHHEAPYVVFPAPAEGRYGFTLIARSGVGKGERPPAPGDQPDLWVEVDETKPIVQLLGTDVSGTPDNAQLTISWRAQDKFMAEKPITISYSLDLTNPNWTNVATGLTNAGTYLWPVPPDLPHHSFYIRVEAVDQAGNVGSATSNAPVVVDLATPKARIKGVEAAPAVPGGAPPGGMSGVYNTPPPVAPVMPNPVVQVNSATVAPAAPPTSSGLVAPAPLPAPVPPPSGLSPAPLPNAATQPLPPQAP